MTMRATVERAISPSTNDYGRPTAAAFVEVATGVPCRAWSKMRRDSDDSGKAAVVEDMRAMVPTSVDIEEGDQLTITDRRGNVQFAGPVLVEAKQRRGSSGSRASYDLLMLRGHV